MKDRRDEVTAAMAGAGWEMGDCDDLLHRPFTPACWGLSGGPARHLSLWWQYQGRASLRRRVGLPFRPAPLSPLLFRNRRPSG